MTVGLVIALLGAMIVGRVLVGGLARRLIALGKGDAPASSFGTGFAGGGGGAW